jgi:hypothetical protein
MDAINAHLADKSYIDGYYPPNPPFCPFVMMIYFFVSVFMKYP